MQKSNNRFNKPRNSDKKPSFKSGNKKTDSKRPFKKEKDFDKPHKGISDKKDKFSDRSKSDKPFKKREFVGDEKRSFRDKDKSHKPFDSDKKPFRKRSDSDKKFDRPFKKRDGDEKRSFRDKDKSYKSFDSDKKSFSKRGDKDEKKFERPFKKRLGEEKNNSINKDKSHRSFDTDKKHYFRKDRDDKSEYRESKKDFSGEGADKKNHDKKDHDRGYKKSYTKHHDKKRKSKHDENHVSKHTDGSIRLNKYLSNAGVSSRREADDLIKAGAVSVNGKVITEMGYRVMPSDKISYGGETLRHEKKVYLILNKPKDYLTTTDDPRERRTVMELIDGACRERIYPIGRLDRNTTGLLLFTNDGEMATKLMHPKHGIKKIYHVLLNKNMKPADYARLHEGVELEDGFIKPDDVSFTGESKKEIGIEIHSGKNRIVRRIFEHLGYEVVKLDRVVFAGLTKKDLPRGKWRFLSDKEIGFLKMIG